MARTHTPTAILEARGSFIKHPERERPDELKPTGTLSVRPPSYFTKSEKKVWREFVLSLPPGVATAWDKRLASSLVILLAKEEARTITCAERAQMITLAAKFGMTPADRAKISVEQPKENKLLKFLNNKSTTSTQ